MTNNWAIVWSFFFQTFYKNLKLQTMTQFFVICLNSIHPSIPSSSFYLYISQTICASTTNHQHSNPITNTPFQSPPQYHKINRMILYDIISYQISSYDIIWYHIIQYLFDYDDIIIISYVVILFINKINNIWYDILSYVIIRYHMR